MKKYKYQYDAFNIHLTQEDRDLIDLIKNKYCINISGLFKVYIRNMVEQLEKLDYKPDVK